MPIPMNPDIHHQHAYGEENREIHGWKNYNLTEGLSPIVVNDRDTGHSFALQPNSSLPARPQSTTILNNKWDEILVGGQFGTLRGEFWRESNCPLEYVNPGLRPWLWVPIIHASRPAKDDLPQIVEDLTWTVCTTV